MTLAAPAPPAAAPPAPARRAGGRFAAARAVFERDFLVFTSRGRFLVLRTLAVALPAIVLVTVLAFNERTIAAMNWAGPMVFGIFSFLVPLIALLLAPIMTASCIASERALHTLPLVLAAPVSPYAFSFAKFASRCATALVLALATFPLAGVALIYGGVSVGLFLDLAAFTAGIAVMGTAAGLVTSCWCRSVAAAATMSYLLALVIPALHAASVKALAWGRAVPWWQLPHANPFLAWGEMMQGAVARGTAARHPGLVFLAWSCGLAALAIGLCGWRLAREAGIESRARTAARAARPLRYDNPVLDRGLRGTLLHRPRFSAWARVALVLLVAALVLAIAHAENDLDDAWPHVIVLGATTLIAGLACLSNGAHALAAERETGALDMLLATRLTLHDVVLGKLGAVVGGAAPLLAIATLYGAVMVPVTKLDALTLLVWLLSAAVVCVFCAAAGLRCSATAATTGRAVLGVFAFVLGGSVVHAVVAGVLTAIAATAGPDELIAYFWCPSPFYVAFVGMGLADEPRWDSERGHAFAAWMLGILGYVAASAVLVTWTQGALRRRRETG